MGFAGSVPDREGSLRRALRQEFSAEFLGRLDAVVPFHRPDLQSRRAIVEKLLAEFSARVSRNGRILEIDQAVADYLCARWPGDGFGVRSLRRCLDRELADPLARVLSEGRWTGRANAVLEENQIKIVV